MLSFKSVHNTVISLNIELYGAFPWLSSPQEVALLYGISKIS